MDCTVSFKSSGQKLGDVCDWVITVQTSLVWSLGGNSSVFIFFHG